MGAADMDYRTFNVAGRDIAIALEEPFWECLEDLATRRRTSLGNLVHSLETRDPPDIASALRVLVLADIMETAGIELTAFRPPCEPAKKYH
jgi:predicted DNA-binding ribbon-helix-helix protein